MYLRDLLIGTLYGQDYIYNFEYWETWPQMQAIMNEHLRRIFTDLAPIPNGFGAAAQRLRAVLAGQ